MDEAAIRAKIKQVIKDVAGIAVEEIGDTDSFIEDLGLDSLTLLEIGVGVDYEFRLELPDEDLEKLVTVADAVALVKDRLATRDVA